MTDFRTSLTAIRTRLKQTSVRQTASAVSLVAFRRTANFAVGFLLAGILGAASYGSYAFIISSLNILQTVCFIGLDVFLMREIAHYSAANDYKTVRGVIRFSLIGTLGATTIVALGLLCAGIYLDPVAWPQLHLLTRTAPIILPLIIAMRLAQAILRGYQRPTIGLMPEFMIRPLLIIAVTLTLSIYAAELTAEQALWIFAASTAVSVVMAVAFLRRTVHGNAIRGQSTIRSKSWAKASAALFYVFFLQAIYTDASVVFLGVLSTAEETARFRLSFMIASLIPFLLTAINTPLGPIVSAHLSEGRKRELQELVTFFARISLAFGLILAALVLAFGGPLLAYFGSEYQQGYLVLAILSIFQLINVAVGPAMTVLTMSGNEGGAARGITLVAMISLILNPLFIVSLGSVGAAWANGVCLTFFNVYLLHMVRVRVGISTTVLRRSSAQSLS